MSQYEKLDSAIIEAVKNGYSPLSNWKPCAEAARIAEITGREGFRIIDARIQAMRKAGVITHMTKAQSPNGCAGWRLCEKGGV